MLIEDYIHSIETPYTALEILSDLLFYEVNDNYWSIKRGDQEKILDRILAISYMYKFVVEQLQKNREKIRKTINKNYKMLIEEEI